jgi:hypothetical protein
MWLNLLKKYVCSSQTLSDTVCLLTEFDRILTVILISSVGLVTLCEDYGDVSAVSELQHALKEYLPVVLGLTMKGLNLCLFTFM